MICCIRLSAGGIAEELAVVRTSTRGIYTTDSPLVYRPQLSHSGRDGVGPARSKAARMHPRE